VKPSVIVGIVKGLAIFPLSVTAGETTFATVTLEEAVPTDTVVGIAAAEPGAVHGLVPMKPSSIATVPNSVEVKAGETTATFEITTSESLPPGAVQKATIIATAVVMRVATLTIVPEPTNWRKISYT